jgi:hypothetical protein
MAARSTPKPNNKVYATHNGVAHLDDFLAACMLVAKGYKVIRRSERDSDFDGDVLKFDFGGGPLDHHQLPMAGDGLCSVHLVAEHLGVPLYGEWSEVVGVVDCGRNEARAQLKPEAWVGNPIIKYALGKFSSAVEVAPDTVDGEGAVLSKMMCEIGNHIIDESTSISRGVENIKRYIAADGSRWGDAREGVSHEATAYYSRLGVVDFLIVPNRNQEWVSVIKKGELEFPHWVRHGAKFIHPNGFMMALPLVHFVAAGIFDHEVGALG